MIPLKQLGLEAKGGKPRASGDDPTTMRIVLKKHT